MSIWYNSTQEFVEAANIAMAMTPDGEDHARRILNIWEPVANALAASIRDDLAVNWPAEASLAEDLGPDFVGMTSDTGKVVSWSVERSGWREFVIHD